jgi:hypothetical protein
MPTRLPQPDWMNDCAAGDVLREENGKPRLVRDVSRTPDGRLRAVHFAIRRCSWTKRPLTCLMASDLRNRKFRRIARLTRWEKSVVDLKLDIEIADPYERLLFCCDAKGLP